jgi:hypothetical protein
MTQNKTSQRDNFPRPTVKTLAERAHYICSNPECIKMTVRPHDDPTKSTITGVAAHINGASDGKKAIRFDPNQTSDERKHINNGIWLCHDCSDMVDKDQNAYTATLLMQWKKTHEEFIKTLQVKGYASTLELLKPTTIEVDLSKQLINFFEDKRILYDLYEKEIPKFGLRSVLDIRSELTRIKQQLGQTAALYLRVEQIQNACRKFFNELNDIDLDTLKYDPQDPDWRKFVATLSELRKIIGIHIAELSTKYKIAVSDDLKQILPTTD